MLTWIFVKILMILSILAVNVYMISGNGCFAVWSRNNRNSFFIQNHDMHEDLFMTWSGVPPDSTIQHWFWTSFYAPRMNWLIHTPLILVPMQLTTMTFKEFYYISNLVISSSYCLPFVPSFHNLKHSSLLDLHFENLKSRRSMKTKFCSSNAISISAIRRSISFKDFFE